MLILYFNYISIIYAIWSIISLDWHLTQLLGNGNVTDCGLIICTCVSKCSIIFENLLLVKILRVTIVQRRNCAACANTCNFDDLPSTLQQIPQLGSILHFLPRSLNSRSVISKRLSIQNTSLSQIGG